MAVTVLNAFIALGGRIQGSGCGVLSSGFSGTKRKSGVAPPALSLLRLLRQKVSAGSLEVLNKS